MENTERIIPAKEFVYLDGPKPRINELVFAFKIFIQFIKGVRALHFLDPCITVFGSARFGEDNLFKIESNKKFVAYAYISQAASKTALFDYLVLLDSDLVVIKTKVLIYREEYGGEIGSRRWLKQFIGKTQNDDLKYGQNIIAISGATISVRSFTEAINNVLKSLKILHSKNVL